MDNQLRLISEGKFTPDCHWDNRDSISLRYAGKDRVVKFMDDLLDVGPKAWKQIEKLLDERLLNIWDEEEQRKATLRRMELFLTDEGCNKRLRMFNRGVMN